MLKPNEEKIIREAFTYQMCRSDIQADPKTIADWFIDYFNEHFARFREREGVNYCDSRTPEERERDSKIEVAMTTASATDKIKIVNPAPIEDNIFLPSQPKEQPSELSQCCGKPKVSNYTDEGTGCYLCQGCLGEFIPKEEKECKRCGFLKSTVDKFPNTKCIPDKRMGTTLEGVHDFVDRKEPCCGQCSVHADEPDGYDKECIDKMCKYCHTPRQSTHLASKSTQKEDNLYIPRQEKEVCKMGNHDICTSPTCPLFPSEDIRKLEESEKESERVANKEPWWIIQLYEKFGNEDLYDSSSIFHSKYQKGKIGQIFKDMEDFIASIEQKTRNEAFTSGRQSGYAEGWDYGIYQGRLETRERVIDVIEEMYQKARFARATPDMIGQCRAYVAILEALKELKQ